MSTDCCMRLDVVVHVHVRSLVVGGVILECYTCTHVHVKLYEF